MMVQKGGPRRNASSAEQSRGQNVWSAIQRIKGSYEISKRKLLPPH